MGIYSKKFTRNSLIAGTVIAIGFFIMHATGKLEETTGLGAMHMYLLFFVLITAWAPYIYQTRIDSRESGNPRTRTQKVFGYYNRLERGYERGYLIVLSVLFIPSGIWAIIFSPDNINRIAGIFILIIGIISYFLWRYAAKNQPRERAYKYKMPNQS